MEKRVNVKCQNFISYKSLKKQKNPGPEPWI